MASKEPSAGNGPDAAEQASVIDAPVGIRSLSLTLLAVVAAAFALRAGQEFFIPLVLSILISYALSPVVEWLERWRLPRAAGAAVVLVLMVGAVTWGLHALRDQALSIVERIPEAAQQLRTELRRDKRQPDSTVQQLQDATEELEKAAREAAAPSTAPRGVMRVQIEEPPIRIRDYLRWGSAGVVTIAAQLVSVLFLVYFMLASGDLFKRKIVQISGPTLSKKKITVQILEEINLQIERFLIVRLLTSVVVGVASWLAFLWLGLDEPAIWGLAAGLFNSIPYFGPVVVTGGIAVVALMQFGTVSMALLIAGTAAVITSLEGFLLTPWLTGRAARMNAVAIFVGLLFWTWVWGIWGTLLAVPMLMATKAICDRIEDLQPIGQLLGE